MTSLLDTAAVEAALDGTRFSGSLHHVASTESTNLLALAAAHGGARGGVWTADEQTGGRGRGGHRWHSPAGDGLYVSVLVAPRLMAEAALQLSFAAGLAAQQAIARVTNLQVDLRWPNDLMLGERKGHERKCGGILVETATDPVGADGQPPRLRYAVIGVGINVAHAAFPPELEHLATSLRREAGRGIAREPLLAELLRALDDELTAVEREGEEASQRPARQGPLRGTLLLQRFAAQSSWVLGKRVAVEDRYTGTTAGLTDHGFLKVDGDDGILHIVRSGGVRALAAPETHSRPQPK